MSPNQRKAGTSQHNLWLDDDLWAAAQAKAASEKTSISALVREFLTKYVTENHPNRPCIRQRVGPS